MPGYATSHLSLVSIAWLFVVWSYKVCQRHYALDYQPNISYEKSYAPLALVSDGPWKQGNSRYRNWRCFLAHDG